MTPPRQRKGSAGPAKAEEIQPRPAAPAQKKEFPPNPVAGVKAGREQPVDRVYQVIGPKAVGDVAAPGRVVLCLTDGQAAALIQGGHVKPWDGDPEDEDPPSGDGPMSGTNEEGN